MKRFSRPRTANGLHGRLLAFEYLERRDLLTVIRLVDWNTANLPNTGPDQSNVQTILSAIGTEVIQGNAQRIDILAVQETDTIPAGGSIATIASTLETLYPSSDYATSVSTVDGGGDQTGFIYDTSTVSLLEAFEVPGALTHGILRGKFRPESTLGESDFYVYSIHLKSGSASSDRSLRDTESQILRANADALPEGSNVLFVGDFNMQSSNEAAYGNILVNGTAHMRDLAGVDAAGSWLNNPAFKELHSHDGRTGGTGMNDRFDIMFGTDELYDGTGFEYVDSSYHVFSNDGTHVLGGSINSGPDAGDPVRVALAALSDHLPVVSDFEIISGPGVRIIETGGQTKVEEGGITDTYNVVLNTVPGSNVTVTVQPNSQLNIGAGAGVPVNLLFTPGTALIPQVLTVSAVNDTTPEAAHMGIITHTSVSSDSNYNALTIEQLPVHISDNDVQFLINEIDSDTPSTDVAEFVEIYDGGVGNLSLDDLTLVFFNGGAVNDVAYYVFSLNGYSTDANGYFLIGDLGVSGVDATFVDGTLQNGADAVALYVGAFPEEGAPTADNLVDAIVYGTSDPTDANLVAILLQSGQAQANEGTSGLNSLSRVPNGGGLPRETSTFNAQGPTPGLPNVTNGQGVVVTQTGGSLAVIEGGISDSYKIRLQSVPADNVTITLDPDSQLNLGAGIGVAIQLIFTPANALLDQTINVTAVDDGSIEGVHNGVIVHTSASSDDDYDGIVIPNVTALIGDNDSTPPVSPVVISEIMYNPGSNETRNMSMNGIGEWIEIVNTGATTVNIGGWKLDDEDTGTDNDWSAIPLGTMLGPGQVAVLFDADFIPGSGDEATFRAEWNVPLSALVIPLDTWGNLANSPSSVAPLNEMLQLLNASSTVMDTVNYDDANFWPTGINGQSIYLTNLALDDNAGQNWARSEDGVNGAIVPTGPNFNNNDDATPDVGSPGVVPVVVPVGLPGDYNNDHVVNALDYTVWRNNLNDANEADINNNGDGGDVAESDFTWWKQHYGDTSGPGGGGIAGGGGLAGTSATLVAEPAAEPTDAALDEAIVGFVPTSSSATAADRTAVLADAAVNSGDSVDLLLALDRSSVAAHNAGTSFNAFADSSAGDFSDVDQAFATLDDLALAAAL